MNPFINSDFLFEMYKTLFDFHHDACFALDPTGNIQWVNDAALAISGYSREETLQMPFISLIEADSLEKTLHYVNRIVEGKREEFRTSIIDRYGNKIDLSVKAAPIYTNQQFTGIAGTAKNITEQNRVEVLLSGQNKVLEMIAKGYPFQAVLDTIISVIEKASDGGLCSILLTDESKQHLVTGASPNLPTGYSAYINGISIGPDAGSCGTAAYLKSPVIVSDIAADPLWRKYKKMAIKHGLKACWSSPVYDYQQEVLGTFAMYYCNPRTPNESDKQIIDKATHLTSLAIQHYQAEEKINFMAYHDDLTGLPNRRLFDQRVKTAIKNNQNSSGHLIGIMYLDLDRFKLINDSLGHNIGDMLLQEVAQRLQSCVRKSDISSRQGGDEFTILLDGISKQEAKMIAEGILSDLSKSFLINGHEVFVTPSIGISFYPLDGENPDELLRKADMAMYHAKKEGKNNFQFYHSLLDEKSYEKLAIENGLRKALIRKEFTLHYQPIMDLATNKMSGVEALLRWEHPILGKVPPDRFIPIAEETGMIVPIGEWVLQTACDQLKKWEMEGLLPFTISVNLSIRQFYQPGLIPMIKRILRETGVHPEQLMIEITESMTMDVEKATIILYELKSLGVKVSIDDFGTGYSSLSYLKTFPIDYLKIDQSFTQDITVNKDGSPIATTILLMAHNLELSVIAEGVETNQQLQFLQEHGCHKAQGYLFSKPVPAEELTMLLKHSSI